MLKVHTRKLGNIAILCLQGRLVTDETAALRNAVNSQSEVSAVVLDLARVNTIDARGLGVMLELRKETESKGIEFRLTNVTKLVRRVLELTHLDSVFEITPGGEVLAAGTFGRATSVTELASCA
jgi:anti-anti-sigma factor